jgi:hypothetical protein
MRLFYWLVVFVLGAFLPSTSLAANANYPVKWTTELQLQSIQEIPQLLTNPGYVQAEVKYVTDDKNQQAIAKTCNDYFELNKKGFVAQDNAAIDAESWFIKTCDSLIYLLHAKPAKYSYIRGFNLQNDYGLLPAEVIFPNLGDGGRPKGDVKTAFPDVQANLVSPTSIILSSAKAGMKTGVSVLGWGDFNGSGYDQMLVFIANYAMAGTYHFYTPFVLARKVANAPIEVVKLPGESKDSKSIIRKRSRRHKTKK